MNEKQLRALLRKEIKTQLNEVGETNFLDKIGSSIRGKLGTGKTQLNLGLSKIDPKSIGKLTPDQKADLVANLAHELGLTAIDYNTIKQRVARKLGAVEKANASESIIKENEELGDLVGLSTAKVGGQTAINYATELLNAMKTLQDVDKAKALGWVLAQIGVKPEELPSMVSKLKMQTKRQATGMSSENTQVNEYVDDYLSVGHKSNEQMLNENILVDLAQALADTGLTYSSEAIEMAAKGDFSAMGNAIDNALKVPKEAATLVLSLFGIATGTGVAANAAKKAVNYIQNQMKNRKVNLKSNVEDLVNVTADPAIKEAFTKYNKQKALLEAKRHNSAKRKK